MTSRSLIAAAALALVGCAAPPREASAPGGARAEAGPRAAHGAGTEASPAEAPAASSEPAPPPAAPRAAADEALPLRAGPASRPFADSSATDAAPSPCTPETLHARLTELVRECSSKAASLCGSVTVRGSEDGSSVAASVNLRATHATGEFVRCVTDAVGSVRWECIGPGGEVTVELGCTL
ncbi:MAG: hypothetical protein OZ921_00720 [Sorangiineae bacterium]|nr:hypothetical protein [Polyangiaceae bacterium]MEB2321006.1 hypothetical protein [Sorangiineae bacterium]